MLHLILALTAAGLTSPQDDIAQLIEELGAESMEAREEAHSKLKTLGDKAVPALEKAAESTNAEVAARAKHLLKVIPLMKELTENLRKAMPGVSDQAPTTPARLWNSGPPLRRNRA